MTRIAFIGAGSVEFTKNLLVDVLGHEALRDVEVALHDIDPGRLETAGRLARSLADTIGAAPRISTHLERPAALDGADFVINSIQVGGFNATKRDYELPLRHGLRQTIGDTLGIGGIARALRSAPAMLGIGEDMARLCPDAWLLNYTNPMAMLCWLVYGGTPTGKVVGLCHSVQYTMRSLAEIVGVPHEEVVFTGGGINHQSFILRFEHEGQDLYPRLAAAVARDPELQRRVRVDIYRRFGFFPTESSEHSAEYVPWYMRHDDEVERLRIPLGEYVRRSEETLDEYDRHVAQLDRGEPFEIEPSVEYAAEIVNAMVTGEPTVIYGNMRNVGQIENLPRDACVETACLVDSTGVTPVHLGSVPVQCAALNRTFLNVVELTVRGILERDPERIRQAALLDPNCAASLRVAEIDALVDDILAAYPEALA